MNTATALARIAAALQAATVLLDSARRVSEAIRQAQAQGRDLTDDEVASFATADDAARAALETAIAKATPPIT